MKPISECQPGDAIAGKRSNFPDNMVPLIRLEKKVMQRFPKLNLLFLDFDSSVSEVNVQNRLHFMINHAQTEGLATQRYAE